MQRCAAIAIAGVEIRTCLDQSLDFVDSALGCGRM
jgi:hypothetical protein